MHPIDQFSNTILCALYLCICLFASAFIKGADKQACSIQNKTVRIALALSAVPTLAHPAIAAHINGWTSAFLFALPLLPFVCALRLKRFSDKIAMTVVTSLAALYFLECSRLTVLSTLFPPPLFSYICQVVYTG